MVWVQIRDLFSHTYFGTDFKYDFNKSWESYAIFSMVVCVSTIWNRNFKLYLYKYFASQFHVPGIGDFIKLVVTTVQVVSHVWWFRHVKTHSKIVQCRNKLLLQMWILQWHHVSVMFFLFRLTANDNKLRPYWPLRGECWPMKKMLTYKMDSKAENVLMAWHYHVILTDWPK